MRDWSDAVRARRGGGGGDVERGDSRGDWGGEDILGGGGSRGGVGWVVGGGVMGVRMVGCGMDQGTAAS